MKTNLVKFQNTELIAVTVDEQVYVVVKPICEAIGLDADSAVRNLKDDEILGAEACLYTVEVGEKQAKQMLCLPIQLLNGWLFSIQLARVNENAKANLLSYRKTCYQVLFEYFFGKEKRIIQSQKARFKYLQDLKFSECVIEREKANIKQLNKKLEELDKIVFEQLELKFDDFQIDYEDLPKIGNQ